MPKPMVKKCVCIYRLVKYLNVLSKYSNTYFNYFFQKYLFILRNRVLPFFYFSLFEIEARVHKNAVLQPTINYNDNLSHHYYKVFIKDKFKKILYQSIYKMYRIYKKKVDIFVIKYVF